MPFTVIPRAGQPPLVSNFSPKAWVDDPATPINAEALIDLESRLAAYADSLLVGGNTVRWGFGPPDAAIGNSGDFYIDKPNMALYGPKTNGSWGTPASLVGAGASSGGTTTTPASGPTVIVSSAPPSTAGLVDGSLWVKGHA